MGGEDEEVVVKRRGLLKKHALVDYEVWKWKSKLEQSGGTQRVTKTDIQAYAVQAYKNAGITTFKASDGWYRRWRVRWAKPNVVQLKEAKGHEVCEKKNESQSNIKNSCASTNLPKNRSTRNSDLQQALETSKCDGNIGLNMTDDKIREFKDKSKSKRNFYDFPNKLGLVHVQHLNADKCEQFVSSKVLSSIINSSEIDQDVTKRQLKSNAADDNLVRETAISNLTDATSSVGINSNLNDQTPSTSNKYITERGHPDIICQHAILKNSFTDNPANTEDIKDSGQNRQSAADKNSTRKYESKKMDDANYSAQAIHSISNCTQSDSLKESIGGFQTDNGMALPSSGEGLETFTIYSPLLDQRDLDFGDHEFFCDSCEDFHPRKKGFDTNCCKQKKDTSFLRCVFEKKDLNTTTNPPPNNSSEDKIIKKTIDETAVEDNRRKNSSVVLPKGKRYLVQFKRKVVNHALKHNAKQTAAKFKVNRGTVSEWLDERKRLSDCGASKLTPIKALSSPDDSEFLSWLESSKFNLTNDLIKQKAVEWLQSDGACRSKHEWLRMYAHRLNGTEDISIKKRYIAYPEAFKRMVVFHAQTHSNMAAARVFGVARRRVVQWQEIFSVNGAKVKPEVASASHVTDEAVDRELFEWYCTQKPPPSSKQMRCKGLVLYRAAGYHSIQCGAQWYYRWRARHKLPPARDQLHKEVPLLSWALTQLDNNQSVTHVELAQAYTSLTQSTVSRGWTFRFCRKHHKLLQSVPEPSMALPSPLEQQVTSFRQTLLDTVQKAGFTDNNFIAMDEVPLHLLPKDSSKKPLLVRRPGFESCQASLVVSSLADGTLLPTIFVFKGAVPTGSSDPCVVPAANDSGLVSEDIMSQWLSSVCFNHLLGRHGLLIMDSFDVHTAKEVQQTMTDHQVHQAVIPGGCGFKLLPITRVCQLFKSMLEDMCQVYLTNQMMALSSPSPDQLYLWSVRVHQHLAKHQKENIKTAFKEMLLLP